MAHSEVLLELVDLKVYFKTDEGLARSVDGVSYKIMAGETLGLVGESGCGKSVTSLSILRLIPQPPGEIAGGKILFKGQNLLDLNEDQMRAIRGNQIAMIFQEPMTSLNPVYTVGNQLVEAIRNHQKDKTAHQARVMAIDALKAVNIPSPETRIDEYPHQMSGGMKQRVMIAMALVCNPSLLIADEPTTALDVTIQAQILDLMRKLQKERGMSILLVTHDLGVVAEMSDRVAVMYAGKVVEFADVHSLFNNPKHPYTVGLFRSLPNLEQRVERLEVIEGMVPKPQNFPSGCRFRNRCKLAEPVCADKEPLLVEVEPGHPVACHIVHRALGMAV